MKSIFLLLLLVLPAVILPVYTGRSCVAYAEEDLVDDEGEAEVEGEGDTDDLAATDIEEDEEEVKTTASPDGDTVILFVKPVVTGVSQIELPGGVPVEFLVGFRNKGKQDFTLETIDASFRYPMDYNFYIQNFSAISYNRQVSPAQEATLAYSFIPSESFAGRPFGLNINLAYRDASGNSYLDTVFNETVQIIELDEGLDGETFFLYVFLAAGVILLLVIGQQTLLSVGRKRTSRKVPVETGTSNPNNVDYDWLPKQTLDRLNKEKSQKSPKATKQQQSKQAPAKQTSPRQRKAQRKAGSE
ncbi:translocon-associated protein subunit alpha [Photinus pyralis]|uniref:translocon-associated protein subunit alpha n=1 Tax=Photinus pyralis TaxID=7054 RepID=UPI0012677463|nr:translocon-associated protein subunit alpha [Photinus pyralis]